VRSKQHERMPGYSPTASEKHADCSTASTRRPILLATFFLSMRFLDRTRLAEQYRGQWLALKKDRRTVVASGKTARSVLEAARKKGHDAPVITRMPQVPRNFVGFHPGA
jgi:hypothetical protein